MKSEPNILYGYENLREKCWIGKDYTPPRWMRREAYYKAKRLHKLHYNYIVKHAMVGEIGSIFGVHFIESDNVGELI